ncbi:MAG: hypothetical protein HOO96_14800 [Polyangiaceae bacterium]|nr:hypothetical protein [Polyangiaceae bacterium]
MLGRRQVLAMGAALSVHVGCGTGRSAPSDQLFTRNLGPAARLGGGYRKPSFLSLRPGAMILSWDGHVVSMPRRDAPPRSIVAADARGLTVIGDRIVLAARGHSASIDPPATRSVVAVDSMDLDGGNRVRHFDGPDGGPSLWAVYGDGKRAVWTDADGAIYRLEGATSKKLSPGPAQDGVVCDLGFVWRVAVPPEEEGRTETFRLTRWDGTQLTIMRRPALPYRRPLVAVGDLVLMGEPSGFTRLGLRGEHSEASYVRYRVPPLEGTLPTALTANGQEIAWTQTTRFVDHPGSREARQSVWTCNPRQPDLTERIVADGPPIAELAIDAEGMAWVELGDGAFMDDPGFHVPLLVVADFA